MVLLTISSWLGGMEPLQRAFWVIALLATLVFAIQMVLTLVGIGDTDADVDTGGLDADATGDTMDTGGAIQLFTIRNMVNLLLGIGWGGVCFYSSIPSRPLLLLVAVLCGIAMVVAFLLMFRQLMKLESNGAFRIEDCVGKACDVYLRIPAARSGQGKVQVSFGGSVQELDAVTDGEQLPSGAKVRVVQLIEGRLLLVEKI
ncbi:MAG: NfeD family protein [Bacteroidaceae bacterium]|nr:NfeD family protein [Bacteroidaceae bacterium]